MFMVPKSAVIFEFLLRLVAPCVVAYLQSSNHPLVTAMDPGKKMAILALLAALNQPDKKSKEAMKLAEIEVQKIQGGG